MQSEGFNQDTHRISTILEDMFQSLDDGVVDKKRKYRRLQTEWRLRAALVIFLNEGLARLDETRKPLPMWVPTKELLDVLGTSRLSTAVDPLVMPAGIMSRSLAIRPKAKPGISASPILSSQLAA